MVFFLSADLMEYEEIGLLKLRSEYMERIFCVCDQESGYFRILWQEKTGKWFAAELKSVEDLRLADVPKALGICPDNGFREAGSTDFTAGMNCPKLLPPVNTSVQFPEQVEAANPEELMEYRACAR